MRYNGLKEYYFKVRYVNETVEFESTINVDDNSIDMESALAKIIISNEVGDVIQLPYNDRVNEQEKVEILEKRVRIKEISSFKNKGFESKGFVHVKETKTLYDNEIYFLLYYSTEKADIPGTISNNLIKAFKRQGYEEKQKEYTRHIVERFLKRFNMNNSNYVLCCVPGHKARPINMSNLANMLRQICSTYRMQNGINYLIRTEDVMPQTREINRTLEKHLTSIKLNEAADIKGKTVVLMDDFVFSGTTMKACKKILLDAGAKKVICFAMAHVGYN